MILRWFRYNCYYWYHFCFYNPYVIYFYCKVFIYFRIFLASRSITFPLFFLKLQHLLTDMFLSLSRIMMSGSLLGMVLSLVTCCIDFGICFSNFIPISLHMLKCIWAHALSYLFIYCYFNNIGNAAILFLLLLLLLLLCCKCQFLAPSQSIKFHLILISYNKGHESWRWTCKGIKCDVLKFCYLFLFSYNA
jgi:hypothetical protein